MSDFKDDEEERRILEINTFSAMAGGGSFHAESTTAQPVATSTKPSATGTGSEITETSTTLNNSKSNDSASLFVNSFNAVEDSGTFAFASSPSPGNASSNLQAAVAALTGEAAAPLSPQQKLVFPQNNAPTKVKKSIAMHSEKVILPRPLFFGPIVPPRVLKETRRIVGDAMRQAKGKQLPPHVENLIGSIKAFGYGLSPYPTTDGIDESDPRFYTGSPYLTTYQPVWGNDTRSERLENWKKKSMGRKPKSHIKSQGRSVTSPPATNDHPGVFQSWSRDEDVSPMTPRRREGKASLEGAADSNDIFLKWVRGANDSPSPTHSTSKEAATSSNHGIADDQNAFLTWASGDDSDSPLKSSDSAASRMNDTHLFSKLARGEGSSGGTRHVSLRKSRSAPVPSREQSLFSKWARGEDMHEFSGTIEMSEPPSPEIESDFLNLPPPSEEQAMFSRWALAGNDINSDGSMNVSTPKNATGTLLNVPQIAAEDSDDDSVVGSEMKKKVGVNEHIDAALLSLAGGRPQAEVDMESSESITAEQAQALLSQLGQTTPGGRALSNLELTGGCVPVFGCDDPALPVESDLGIYETREDQQHCLEKRREQEIIEKHTVPDMFGTISCPNPAIGPDDNHSSNLRTVPARKSTAMSAMVGTPTNGAALLQNQNGTGGRGTPLSSSTATNKQGPASSPDVPTLPPLKRLPSGPFTSKESGKPPRQGDKASIQSLDALGTTSRFGWWNIVDEDEGEVSELMPATPGESLLLNPRTDFTSDSLLVNTRLEPTPAKLRAENAPLSRLHSATTVASSLPFLSDRPPSWRYLQIDTKAIGFSALGGEIEPLFCSLAIYHVETMSTGSNDNSSVPIPNLQKCGRVTEVLHFDVVSDLQIEERCFGALWPFHDGSPGDLPESERTQGTRCGVFPIPSNLNIANLYAIIVVQRVLSDKSDMEAYTKQDQDGAPLRSTAVDREKYREKAQKASERQGQFVMPFAFGVTPLLQVFGTDTPVVPISRAVQIPLFQFRAGISIGERQIIDHIMVMLYPRANLERAGIAGPAPNTNGGTVMLVMRYFGYLGLHSVLNSKRSLSRHRLVDFTGELQIRRVGENEAKHENPSYRERSDRDYVVDSWGVNYVAEPTALLGRNVVHMIKTGVNSTERPDEHNASLDASSEARDKSTLYAQELAAVPLQVSPTVGRSMMNPLRMGRGRYGLQSSDSEPYFHSSFCNELLCTPRLVHNCPKGNIVTKIELREVQWDEELNSHVARLPEYGPCIHNQRRGPVFVNYAFTSCSFSSTTVSFLSEFKVKLPLTLCVPGNPLVRFALLFSVYHVEIKPKKTWAERGKSLSKQFGVQLNNPLPKKAALRPLGCGFLPITYNADTTCLIDNGFHDVKLCYDAKQTLSGPDDEIVLTLKPESQETIQKIHKGIVGAGVGTDEADSDGGSVDDNRVADDGMPRKESLRSRASSIGSQAFSDATSDQLCKASSAAVDQMSLQVRVIVHSSVHPQNATLTEFLQLRASSPEPLSISKLPVTSPWRLGRDDLLAFLRQATTRSKALQQSSERSQKVLYACIDVAKPGLCSGSSLAHHSLRVVEQLLTVLVYGTGEPSLLWANPAMVLPLRIHAFATLLHLIHNVSSHLSRFGLKQLDGKTKWNVATFGTIIAALFDEQTLFSSFGGGATEPLNVEMWDPNHGGRAGKQLDRPTLAKRQSSGSRRRHSRSDSDSLIFSSDSIFAAVIKGGKKPTPSVAIESCDGRGDEILQDGVSNGDLFALHNRAEIHPTSSSEGSALAWTDQKFKSSHDFPDALSLSRKGEDPLQVLANSGFGGPSLNAGRRKFMTLPTNALATIREDNDGNLIDIVIPKKHESSERMEFPISALNAPSPLDHELVRKGTPGPVRQMRVPKLGKAQTPSAHSAVALNSNDLTRKSDNDKETLTTDDAIELAGTAFLDVIGESLGYKPKGTAGEEKHVGHAHHRKTDSTCSIDWTLPADDLPLKHGDSIPASLPLADEATQVVGEKRSPALGLEMSLLKPEMENAKKLPMYLDRVLSIATTDHPNGRWFPYVYEVLIFQWVAILTEQRRQSSKSAPTMGTTKITDEYMSGTSDGIAPLRDAAMRARGCAVPCAPVLLELIKKSLGSRIHCLLRQVDKSALPSVDSPPLIVLDDVILNRLETLIAMVTDACIDSKNFDSKEFQQVSIDVNDSVVRFLRDMFAFLHPACVHRLVLVYFSRFIVKDGKHWQDRDSKIGLRCSWEICKLRLNAVTAFIRLPDFVRINSPQMGNWNGLPLSSQGGAARSFFDVALDTFVSLGMPGFATADGPNANDLVKLPPLRPQWLSELVLDICLSGTEHAEQKIQHRASSLLHELFWSHSVEGKVGGSSSLIASMYVSFLLKVLGHISYLSSLHAKSQLRKDLLPCVVFVLQSAPIGLLQSLWRNLCRAAQGKGSHEKYGPVMMAVAGVDRSPNVVNEANQDPHIFDMLSLLNLTLGTFEYGGIEDTEDSEDRQQDDDQVAVWAKEYLPSIKQKSDDPSLWRGPMGRRYQQEKKADDDDGPTYTSTSSRKWQSHDGSLVVINSCRYIVREMLTIVKPERPDLFASSSLRTSVKPPMLNSDSPSPSDVHFSSVDTVIFVRAAASVYLHSLTLRESDIVITKTLMASVELVKIFGIKVFFEAVGETLQHWMRVVMMHCGARRANVRVQSLEFLALILRVTWNSFGSFFRIRQPLLAVQTEVMERIVAIATTRYYREQRRMSTPVQYLSNDSAEATLSMFWRTLDRLHHQSASQNVAFRSGVVLLAEKMKKLYRAYIAAHALSILKRARSPMSPSSKDIFEQEQTLEVQTLNQSRRISVHRIITASAGYCKQFLGTEQPTAQREIVVHNEALEDAFLDAADVFSPTELPSHRVAWLQKLAEFHADRHNYAEEATCHFHVQLTLRQAARLHEMIWSSAPFLPWTDSVHIDGEGPAGEPDEYYDADDFDDTSVEDRAVGDYGRQIEKTNTFRRIFYRVANSVRMRTGDWEISGNKHLFYGVTFASEYGSSSPWMSLREMEERMIEAAEAAGELYLSAGIPESSRAAWGLATSYYAVRFNYAKLARAYRQLSLVVASQVPFVDTNEQGLDFSHPIGRFYRVWFHGGAPDDLLGAEFVYRAPSSVKLQEFGDNLSRVIRSILPENTPIDLVLDDGRPEQHSNWRSSQQRRALGPGPLEPVKIKATPLRPLLRKSHEIRGTPEWFLRYIESAFTTPGNSNQESRPAKSTLSEGLKQYRSHHRYGNHSRSYSASMFGSIGSNSRVSDESNRPNDDSRQNSVSFADGSELVSADKFTFLQPIKRERNRPSRDWLKSSGDFAEKNLRVTLLQVERSFPACVARQAVIQRSVFTQSPLEAGLDAVCSWCSVLFRTAVATNGVQVLGRTTEHGIGNAASKVVADCVHSGRVKEIGQVLLKKHGSVAEETDGVDYAKLTEDEVRVLQIKLARSVVVFIEILHLLISRNRDQLLAVVDARKGTNGAPTSALSRQTSGPEFSPVRMGISSASPSMNPSFSRANSISAQSKGHAASGSYQDVPRPDSVGRVRSSSAASVNTAITSDRTDLAIAVQSELQRAFISLCRALYPNISMVLESETPRWLKQCSQDNYFSFYTYRQTNIPMADEVCFFSGDDFEPDSDSESFQMTGSFVSSGDTGLAGYNIAGSESGSAMDGSSVVSRGTKNHGAVRSSDSFNMHYV